MAPKKKSKKPKAKRAAAKKVAPRSRKVKSPVVQGVPVLISSFQTLFGKPAVRRFVGGIRLSSLLAGLCLFVYTSFPWCLDCHWRLAHADARRRTCGPQRPLDISPSICSGSAFRLRGMILVAFFRGHFCWVLSLSVPKRCYRILWRAPT